jgi:hypothetical protein
MCVVVSSFGHSVIRPGWYTSIEFITALAAFIGFELMAPKALKTDDLVSREEFESMKTAISSLGSQLKQTSTKLSGLRMQIGLKD